MELPSPVPIIVALLLTRPIVFGYYIGNGYNQMEFYCPEAGAMDNVSSDPHQELPLTPAVCHILLALAGGEKHGYAIMQEVEEITDGQVTMGPGTLYGSIKRMRKAGLIVESDARADPALDDARRRYYELTTYGRRVLEAEIERLAHVVRLAGQKQLLTGRPTAGAGGKP